jgi:hypothetical protein
MLRLDITQLIDNAQVPNTAKAGIRIHSARCVTGRQIFQRKFARLRGRARTRKTVWETSTLMSRLALACRTVKWRKRVGVEPTGDGVTRRPPVLKTGTITGPHALPEKVALDPCGFRRPGTSRASKQTRARASSATIAPPPLQLLRLRHDPYVRLRRLPACRILFLRFFIGDISADDHVLARLPVRRGGDFVFGGELD